MATVKTKQNTAKAPSIHISKGNTKTGAIPSFSLPSGVTCSKSACETCFKQGCYARKIERLRPSVHATYMDNLFYAKNHIDLLEGHLNAYFSMLNAPRLFRIHVAGDFFSHAYFKMWLRVIKAHPQTKFMAFTKRDAIIQPYLDVLPENFALVWSAWPGVAIPKSIVGKIPVAWMQDGTENRIPETAVSCPGHCENCAKCWAADGKDVVLNKH